MREPGSKQFVPLTEPRQIRQHTGYMPGNDSFIAGMTVGRSDYSLRAATDALPMRDAFAVLFFVSIGMLLDPAALVEMPWLAVAASAVVVVGKPFVAATVVHAALFMGMYVALTTFEFPSPWKAVTTQAPPRPMLCWRPILAPSTSKTACSFPGTASRGIWSRSGSQSSAPRMPLPSYIGQHAKRCDAKKRASAV